MKRLRMAGAVAVASVAALFLCLVGAVDVVEAATFLVEDGNAVGDENPGDGVCRSKLRPGTLLRNCTFLAAMEEANALSGFHTILVPSGTYRFDTVQVSGRIRVSGAGAGVTALASSGIFDDALIVLPNGYLEVRDLTYRDSSGLLNRGGELLVVNSVIRDNAGGFGGGITHRVLPGTPANVTPTTTIRNSRITGNKSGIGTNFVGGLSLEGGQVLIESSTIDGNEGRCGNCPGGILTIRDPNGNQPSVTLRNVTISGNQGGIGGIFHTAGALQLHNVTIAQNSPTGIDANSPDGLATPLFNAVNTMFVNNVGPNCAPGAATAMGATGPFGASKNNLESGTTCTNLATQQGSVFGSAQIGPLESNGGPTPTHALLAGSSAIDAGTCILLTDQRGVARPLDGDSNGSLLCDIGAFERARPGFGIIQNLGVPGLSPGTASVRANETLKETFTWDVPAPSNWGALGALDFRLRLNGSIVFWVRWEQLADTFQLIDSSGQPTGFELPAGADVRLSANGVNLLLSAAEARGSGITGQRATVVLPLQFDDSTQGRVYNIEVSAQDDDGRQDPFTNAGTITVQGAAVSDNDKREREKEKPLTELGRLKKARSNDGGFDDEQTEGNVMATRCDQNEIDIGSMDGIVVLRLRGNSRGVCQYVKVGDYIQVDGQKVNEGLFWVDDLDIDD